MEVLAHIAEPPADPEDAAAGSSSNSPEDAPIPLDPFTQLCYQEMPMAQNLVGRIQTQLPPNLQRNGMVQFMPGKDFGTPLEIKVMVPAIKRMFEMGAMVSALAFEALMYRLGLLLSSAAMCVDEFRMEVLGKQYKAVGPSLGCAGCGKAEGEEGKKLAACASCGVTFYCGEWFLSAPGLLWLRAVAIYGMGYRRRMVGRCRRLPLRSKSSHFGQMLLDRYQPANARNHRGV
jgi:hypothetical protein